MKDGLARGVKRIQAMQVEISS